MYLISKINEDYEGTWSNGLMYENDLEKAKKIAKELQEAMISLKRKYLIIKEEINFVLERQYPNYHSNDVKITIEERVKNIDLNDKENYFEKEERLLKSATDKELNDKEKFLYDIQYMNSSCKLIYFEVRKILSGEEVFSDRFNKDEFWNIEYSTRELSEKHKTLFDTYIN